ncbi:MAG: hypothetical protein PHQ85_09075, partial [Eubacteriales bacterium]|nr:hypothetical protein [Eubacteriales bacterium]MDD4711393.1 hypothetical protein [Eubacteriales bacterium]
FKSVIFPLHPPRVSQTEFYTIRLPILNATPLSTVDLTLGINPMLISAQNARILFDVLNRMCYIISRA